MSNIVDFAKFKEARNLSKRIFNLTDAGFNHIDIAIISIAANRAFSEDVPSIEEVGNMEFENLSKIGVYQIEDHDLDIFTLGTKERQTLTYVFGNQETSIKENPAHCETVALTDMEDPGQFVVNEILKSLQAHDMDALSVYGMFAMDVFYFLANSNYVPLEYQVFTGTTTIGLLMFDEERQIDIALVADIMTWKPTEEDWKVEHKIAG